MYKVTAQYSGSRELPAEQFKDINVAKQYIETKIQENHALKIPVIYRLYEWDDLLQEFDMSKMNLSDASSSDANENRGQGQGSTFSPTPLPTSPRPAGMPHSSFKRSDQDKDKEK